MIAADVSRAKRAEAIDTRIQTNEGTFNVGADYVIDANIDGNVARWINHSCNPNCEAVIEGEAKRLLEAKLRAEYFEVALAASGPEALALSAALPRDWTPQQVFFAITVILSLVGRRACCEIDLGLGDGRAWPGDRAEIHQIAELQLVFFELPDGERWPVDRERRDDDVDAAAVGKARVADRARFVDAAADLAHDALTDVHQLRVVAEADVGALDLARDLDVGLAGPGRQHHDPAQPTQPMPPMQPTQAELAPLLASYGYDTPTIEQGKTLFVKLVATSEPNEQGMRTLFFELNGAPREILCHDRHSGREIKTPTQFYVRTGDFLISKRQIVHGAQRCAALRDARAHALGAERRGGFGRCVARSTSATKRACASERLRSWVRKRWAWITITPSLVTCPTRNTLMPLDLARLCKRLAHSRTCVTVPGAASTALVHMVWIESMIASAGSTSSSLTCPRSCFCSKIQSL